MENDANVDTSLKISPELCKEKKEYEIDKELINKDNTSRLANDPIMKNDENFKIKFIEYAPKVFSYLRVIDEVPVKELVDSLLPNSNQQGLKKSEGRSGSFFIVTDDKKFILKTIAVEEAQLLIEQNLLYEMSNFFSEHKTSIISRIYGLFQIKIQTGPFSEDTIYFILMKNVFGNFKDNVLFKYDLKGSQLNRSTKTNLDNLDREVMKDVDFEHIENNTLQLNEKNKNKLVSIIGTDASFLAGQKIMDYSLLVVKLSLNEDEINQLFGKGHKKRTEKEFAEHFGIEHEVTDRGEKEEKIPLVIQWDARWGYSPYGNSNVGLSGCAPTCLTMVVLALTGDAKATPDQIAAFAAEHGYYEENTGTSWSFFTQGCEHFGVHGQEISLDEGVIRKHLQQGEPVVCSMRPGDFTSGGHFIVLAGESEDGRIIVHDPNSRKRSKVLWDYETLEPQIKNLWSFSK